MTKLLGVTASTDFKTYRVGNFLTHFHARCYRFQIPSFPQLTIVATNFSYVPINKFTIQCVDVTKP